MAFNWNVYEINGHSYREIKSAFNKFYKSKSKPTLIIANTIKGKGVSFMEDNLEWHYKSLNKSQLNLALSELK